MPGHPTLTIVVPDTRGAPTLPACVAAIEGQLTEGDELLVVREPHGASPALARNHGAQNARGDVIVFVDSDIVVHDDALGRLRDAIALDGRLTAVFGSYDDRPQGGIVARFRNLLHHHVHSSAAGPAQTFWAGLGAIRRIDFLAAGGFDTQRYPRPMLEDVELGLRLSGDGHHIELRPDVTGTHLKEWSLRQMLRTDLRDRGMPWTRLLLERQEVPPVLNLGWRHRVSAISVLLTVVLTAVSVVSPGLLVVAAMALALFLGLNLAFYRLLWQRMGPAGALAGIALHALHHMVAVTALGLGVVAHVVRRQRFPRPDPLSERRPSRSAHDSAFEGRRSL